MALSKATALLLTTKMNKKCSNVKLRVVHKQTTPVLTVDCLPLFSVRQTSFFRNQYGK